MNTHRLFALAAICCGAALSGCATMGLSPVEPVGADLPPPVAPAPPAPGAIYQPGNTVAFFQDARAHRVGDILTVILQEQTQAQAASSTATGKKDSIAVGIPTVLGHSFTHLNGAASSDNSFSGSGNSQQSNKLTGEISVRVVDVMQNGLLKVAGTKQLQLNQSNELLTLTGFVSERDISAVNTVPSGRVAMARIHYKGRGALGDANRMGWLARFFNSPFWPF